MINKNIKMKSKLNKSSSVEKNNFSIDFNEENELNKSLSVEENKFSIDNEEKGFTKKEENNYKFIDEIYNKNFNGQNI